MICWAGSPAMSKRQLRAVFSREVLGRQYGASNRVEMKPRESSVCKYNENPSMSYEEKLRFTTQINLTCSYVKIETLIIDCI